MCTDIQLVHIQICTAFNLLLWMKQSTLGIQVMMNKAIVELILTYGAECQQLVKSKKKRLKQQQLTFWEEWTVCLVSNLEDKQKVYAITDSIEFK